MTDSQKLLADYVQTGSENAFRNRTPRLSHLHSWSPNRDWLRSRSSFGGPSRKLSGSRPSSWNGTCPSTTRLKSGLKICCRRRPLTRRWSQPMLINVQENGWPPLSRTLAASCLQTEGNARRRCGMSTVRLAREFGFDGGAVGSARRKRPRPFSRQGGIRVTNEGEGGIETCCFTAQ